MKIITWNCNGAFRKKFESLVSIDADILVIQECEDPAESKDKKYKDWASNYLWIGDSKNKGLGVFTKESINIKHLDWPSLYQGHKIKHFLPCLINEEIQLLAVWNHQNNSPNFGYIGQLWKYLQVNKQNFTQPFIIGDFNSNTIWDEWDRWWNHSDVVNELLEKEIESLYHKVFKEEHGKESKPTFYLQRNPTKSYHIDYCFAHSKFSRKINSLNVEPFDKWKHLSDHCPIIISF